MKQPKQKGPATSKLLQKLYASLRSVAGVHAALLARGFKVSRATIHVWLKAAGVKLRARGGNQRPAAKVARPQRRGGTKRFTSREPCLEGRRWGDEILTCVGATAMECSACTRGEAFSREEILQRRDYGVVGLQSGHRHHARRPDREEST